jgi:dCMP deaminase
MEMAKIASQRADCQGGKVGAVVIVEDRIVSTGYNRAPDGVTNCSDGGCPRCAARAGGVIKSGADPGKCYASTRRRTRFYTSARHGITLRGCVIYITGQPCLGCLRKIIQV